MNNPLDPGYYCSEELRSFGFARVGENVRIARNCVVIGPENIEIGDNVRIDAGTVIIVPNGTICLASHIHIATNCLLGGRGGISVGSYCVISHGTRVLSASDDFSGSAMTSCEVPPEWTAVNVAPVSFGDHTAVGANSVVLPGVTFGEGAALGCLSVASRDLSPWSIWAGSPARLVNQRSRALLRHLPSPESMAA